MTTGFSDPNNKYPLYNELERSHIQYYDKSLEEIAALKEEKRKVGVPNIDGLPSWDEPHCGKTSDIQYDYVQLSNSGHVIEIDDTPGSERLHTYHRSGTFNEIISDGTNINRIVGNRYTIIEKNGFITIAGDANVCVTGNINIVCQSDVNIQSYGKTDITSGSDIKIAAAGDIDFVAGGMIGLYSNECVSVTADKNIHVYAGESAFVSSDDQLHFSCPNDHCITSESANVYIKAGNNINAESDGTTNIKSQDMLLLNAQDSVQIRSDSGSMALSSEGGIDLSSFGAIAVQSTGSQISINTPTVFAVQGMGVSVKGIGFVHIASTLETAILAGGEVTVSAFGAVSVIGTGMTLVKSFGTLALTSSSMCAIDAPLISLQSGIAATLGLIYSVAVSITDTILGAVNAPCAYAATAAGGSCQAIKAVPFGGIPPSIKTPVYPSFEETKGTDPLEKDLEILLDAEDENEQPLENKPVIQRYIQEQTGDAT